jgi:hypothetical protein
MNAEIQAKYDQLKRDKPEGWDIGQPLSGSSAEGEKIFNDGNVFYFKHFSNGSIYYTPHAGTSSVHGLIKAKYDTLGGLDGFLLPANDETLLVSGRGRYNNFLSLDDIQDRNVFWLINTSIIWKGGTNEAFAISGRIMEAWNAQGGDRGALGFPTSDEIHIPESEFTFAKFEHGVICITNKDNIPMQYSKNVLIADDFLGITNATSASANVRLYYPSPNCSPGSLNLNNMNQVNSCFPLLTAITLIQVPAKTTVFWQLPAGHKSIIATFNGNIPVSGRPLETFSNIRLISSRNHHIFSVGSSVTVNNQTSNLNREIKFFKSTDTSFATPLPNGIQTLSTQLIWRIPEDVAAVNIVIDGIHLNGPFKRGSVINFNPPTSQTAIFIVNNSGKDVTVRLYDEGDLVRWGTRQPPVLILKTENLKKVELSPITSVVQVTFNGKGLMKVAAGATAIIS